MTAIAQSDYNRQLTTLVRNKLHRISWSRFLFGGYEKDLSVRERIRCITHCRADVLGQLLIRCRPRQHLR